jgi:hypothetical protein
LGITGLNCQCQYDARYGQKQTSQVSRRPGLECSLLQKKVFLEVGWRRKAKQDEKEEKL